MGSFHGIADVFAVARPDLADQPACRVGNGRAVPTVRAGLFAADVHFRRAVNWGHGKSWFLKGRRGLGGPVGRSFFELGLPLGFHVFPKTLPAAFPAEAGFLVTPETGGCIENVGAIDPDRPGFYFWGNVECQVDILGPDAGSQAKARVVGQFDGFGWCPESHAGQHRAEDFDLGNRGGRRNIREQSGRVKIPVRRTGPGRLPHGAAFVNALLY